MNIAIPQPLKLLGRAFSERGVSLYAVGGLVRNTLLGLPLSDWDTASAAPPERAAAIGRELGLKADVRDAAFGTVRLSGVLGGERFLTECTTFRREVYAQGGSHRPTGVVFSQDLAADAFRRDFTVNALYAHTQTGEVIDPTGGQKDLKKRLIRATTPDPNVILQDDGLRVLRLARFACELGFEVEKKTLAAARAHAHGLWDIPGERRAAELVKLLLSDARYGAPQPGGASAPARGILLLHSLGALGAVLPSLLPCCNVQQDPKYHRYDVFHHSVCAMAFAPPALVLRLAALLHDVGKPLSLSARGDMHEHPALGAEAAGADLAALRLPKALAERVCALIEGHMYDLRGDAKEKTLRRRFAQLGPEFVRQLAEVRRADFRGSAGRYGRVASAERWLYLLGRMEGEGAPFSPNELAVTGRDLMALGFSGPAVGEVKHWLWLHAASFPKENTPARLLRLAEGYKKGAQKAAAREAEENNEF